MNGNAEPRTCEAVLLHQPRGTTFIPEQYSLSWSLTLKRVWGKQDKERMGTQGAEAECLQDLWLQLGVWIVLESNEKLVGSSKSVRELE